MLKALLYRLKRRKQSEFKPVVLVTGCSSGLGLALADLLWREERYRVVVTARASSLSVLHERFHETDRFLIRALDVTSEIDRIALIQEIEVKWTGVNVLINNAGISYRAVVEHMTELDERKQMATNYLGPMGMVRLVLPYMRKVGRGKIINISSVSGMLAMPTLASYSASKYALEGASEALWYEMKPLGISVTLVQPGFIRSKSFERVCYTKHSREAANSEVPYGDYYRFMSPFIARLMGKSLSTPESISKQVLNIVKTENPPLWVAATLDAWLFALLRRFVPRRFLLPVLFRFLPSSSVWGSDYSRKRDAVWKTKKASSGEEA